MTNPTPSQAALREVRQRLAAVQDRAQKARHQRGAEIKALGKALIDADDALAPGDTLAAARAALAALRDAHAAVADLAGRHGSPWRDEAQVALRAEADLGQIVTGWPPVPPPPPPLGTVTVAQGPGDVQASATGPVSVSTTLARKGATDLAASVGWQYEGLSASPLGDIAVFKPGAAQALARVTVPAQPGMTVARPFTVRLVPPVVGMEIGVPDTAAGTVLPPVVTPPPPPPPPVPVPPPPPPVPVPPPPPPSGGSRSGLPWKSGFNWDNNPDGAGHIAAFEAFRGRPLDIYNLFQFPHRQGWEQLVKSTTAPGWAPGMIGPILARMGAHALCTIPTIIDGANYADAAAGKYDGYHRRIAQGIETWGMKAGQTVYLRFGREPNDKGQPFSYFNDPSPGYRNYKSTHARYKRIYADVLGEGNIAFDWCVMKRAADWENAYPGDDIVDLIGCDSYINYPEVLTKADWPKFWGIVQPHLDFAVKRGKRFSMAEWGVTDHDMPVAIESMFDKFAELSRAGVLEYESYFNPGHGIVPPSPLFPQSSAAYARKWRP